MRNDLGRVCEYGSIRVAALNEPRPAPGVWHLVSTVRGTLRPDAGDSDLLRASFPPGSVTGAPKIQAMRVIAELEAGGREAYTGAIGYASPVAGLELNVAIRTLEMRGERIWMGAGGGIVADSVAEQELEECFVKARPVIAAAGARLIEEPRVNRIAPVPALAGGAPTPRWVCSRRSSCAAAYRSTCAHIWHDWTEPCAACTEPSCQAISKRACWPRQPPPPCNESA
jgi:para-aminobenzoate synthetase/4-amino-4-deoxychorismate lyase